MATTKISELPAATALNDADTLLVVQGGTTKRITKSNALGTMASQDNDSVDINGGFMDGVSIGASSRSPANISSLSVQGSTGNATAITQSGTTCTIALGQATNNITSGGSALMSIIGLLLSIVPDTPTSGSTGTVALTKILNFVTTQAASDNTVTLPTAAAGQIIVCVNLSGSNTLVVEAGSSDQVDGGASANVAANAVGIFFCKDATDWYSLIA